jgi:hypothetical protein
MNQGYFWSGSFKNRCNQGLGGFLGYKEFWNDNPGFKHFIGL